MPALASQGEVQVVRDLPSAVAALHGGGFDLVICASSELLPLARAPGHERAQHILEGIAQGVCIVGHEGRLVWANAALRAYPPNAIEAVRQACAAVLAEWTSGPAEPGRPRVRQQTLAVGDEYGFDLSVSALPDPSGRVEEVIGLFSDTTAVSRMRERLDAIDAVGRELVALDVDETDELDVGERLKLLENKLIHYCQEVLDYTHFSVRVLDPKTNRLETVLSRGFSEQVDALPIHALPEGNGISGYVAATGKAYICPDITHDPLYLPGMECASSSLVVPLRLVDRIVGVLNVESDQPAKFTDEDRQVAEILGRYLAVALHTLKLLAVERSGTAGQVTADMAAEVSEPLDGIVREASRLMEGGQGGEEARARLKTIVDAVARIKQSLQTHARPPAIRGLLPEESTADPLLAGKRILVADDEEIIRETISDVLVKAGALPVTASDGNEAIAMVHAQPFDLVLSDIKMPHKTGYEVFAASKQVRPACPVILITGFGYDPDHSIVRANREGLAAVLFKPFKVERLMEAIHKAVAAGAEK